MEKTFCYADCKHLNFTEKQQDEAYKTLGRRPEHFCKLYNKQIKHNGFHPFLVKLQECKYEQNSSVCLAPGSCPNENTEMGCEDYYLDGNQPL